MASSQNEQGEADQAGKNQSSKYNDEVYTRRVEAGKRTYFLDVKSTQSGDDYYITVTERKRLDGGGQEKHRIFLYKEDFGDFLQAMHDVINQVRTEYMPNYEFERLPELTGTSEE